MFKGLSSLIVLVVAFTAFAGVAWFVEYYANPQDSGIEPMDTCYVGGCSNQICSDNPDVVSTCEFRAEYACYASAKCERQPSGKCGWTETNELRECLMNPPAL